MKDKEKFYRLLKLHAEFTECYAKYVDLVGDDVDADESKLVDRVARAMVRIKEYVKDNLRLPNEQ
jgi:hypothetical protein